MSKKERLEFYKRLLVDWMQPIDQSEANRTELGFCYHISSIIPIDPSDKGFKLAFPELYEQRDGSLGPRGKYHYNNIGSTEEGRQRRVTALENAIELIKK